jgi:hypothetical protein
LALLAGFDGDHALPLEGFWLFVSAHLTSPFPHRQAGKLSGRESYYAHPPLPCPVGGFRPPRAQPRGQGHPETTERHHFPSCRGGERVLPLDGPSVPAPGSRVKALGWWVSAPSHSLPGRSRDGSIPFGMRRGPPRAHIPPGPSRLDPGGFRPVAALGETVRTVF